MVDTSFYHTDFIRLGTLSVRWIFEEYSKVFPRFVSFISHSRDVSSSTRKFHTFNTFPTSIRFLCRNRNFIIGYSSRSFIYTRSLACEQAALRESLPLSPPPSLSLPLPIFLPLLLASLLSVHSIRTNKLACLFLCIYILIRFMLGYASIERVHLFERWFRISVRISSSIKRIYVMFIKTYNFIKEYNVLSLWNTLGWIYDFKVYRLLFKLSGLTDA